MNQTRRETRLPVAFDHAPDHAPNQAPDPRTSSRVALTLCVAFTLVLCAGSALAAGGGDKSDEDVWKEIIYQAANLLVLLGVLFYFGRKPIKEFFASRRAGIQSELSQAAELLTQAEQRNSELQRKLVDLASEVDEIKASASRRAGDEAERILADAQATAERIRRDASAAIDQELRRAQSQLREEAADLALELAASKLKDQVAESDRERLIDEFITRVEPASGRTDSASTPNPTDPTGAGKGTH
jgi:F-type H+-transporting ATPase subunit b